jgi:simple sugar transport system ATP-binding protein
VSGNGQVALADVLCGVRAATGGQLTYLGQPLPGRPPPWAQGVARIPEDRHGTGVVGDLPVWENAVAERLRTRCFSRWGWVRRRPHRPTPSMVREFDVRGGGLMCPPALSGGNMQS